MLIPDGGRCAQHAVSEALNQNRVERAYNRSRPESDKFYGTRTWKRLRAAVLTRSPLCVECERRGRVVLATVVDHVIPFRDRPDLGMTMSNLRSLCARCHARIGKRRAGDMGF